VRSARKIISAKHRHPLTQSARNFLQALRDQTCTCGHPSLLAEHHTKECGWHVAWVEISKGADRLEEDPNAIE
jgi:hypothetical protein